MTNTITCAGVAMQMVNVATPHLHSQCVRGFNFPFNAEFDKILQGMLKISVPRPEFDKFSLNPKGPGSLKQAAACV